MKVEARIPLFDLITSLADTIDLISPAVSHHQMRVAYIACSLARELDWDVARCGQILMAGALHDVGGFTRAERMYLMSFELVEPHQHGKVGGRLLEGFTPFADIARVVRFHHVPWQEGRGSEFEKQAVPEESLLLHLADRIAVLIEPGETILWQARRIRERIQEMTPRMFKPVHVEAFRNLAAKDYFWIDAAFSMPAAVLRRRMPLDSLELDLDGLVEFANVFRRMIDFRSQFTATHSSGVAAVAAALAERARFSARECRLMAIAGHLHDLGKLGIPTEILQKPTRLTELEYDIMRGHVYHTFRILEPLTDLETIRDWSALHQEYLDGTGYPFRYTGKELVLGARIMAVADVFTALTEDRPYRHGLSTQETLSILQRLSDKAKLDRDVIAMLRNEFDMFNAIRILAQKNSTAEYRQFMLSVC